MAREKSVVWQRPPLPGRWQTTGTAAPMRPSCFFFLPIVRIISIPCTTSEQVCKLTIMMYFMTLQYMWETSSGQNDIDSYVLCSVVDFRMTPRQIFELAL